MDCSVSDGVVSTTAPARRATALPTNASPPIAASGMPATLFQPRVELSSLTDPVSGAVPGSLPHPGLAPVRIVPMRSAVAMRMLVAGPGIALLQPLHGAVPFVRTVAAGVPSPPMTTRCGPHLVVFVRWRCWRPDGSDLRISGVEDPR